MGDSRDRVATAYVVCVILVGALVTAHALWDLVTHPVGLEWLILAALTVASGLAALRIPGVKVSFSISDIFAIAAALVFGPSAGAVTSGLDGLVLSSRMATSARSWDRVLFNFAAPAIATWIAAQAFFALGGPRLPLEGPVAAARLLVRLAVFGTLDYSLNSWMVATAVGFERRLPVVPIWREHFANLWINYFGGVFGAMLLMLLTKSSTVDILILMIPLPVILYVTFKHAMGRAEDQIGHLGKVNRVYVAAIEALAHAVDAKDQVTHDHVRRVQDESVRLARALGVNDEGEIQAIKAAALLHDVGKLAVPEHILNKPGKLTPAEFEIMKRHAPIGADILAVIDFPYAVAPIVRYHHENWDGSGYPDGITGNAIPIGSRILAVVDCFDALTSDRPYRPRLSDRDALKIVSDRSGTMYDPGVVDAFFALRDSSHTPERASALEDVRHAQGATPLPPGEVALDGVDLKAFFALGQSLGEPASLGEVGEALWTHLGPHLPASSFVLHTYDGGGDAIVAAYRAGEGSGAHAMRMQLGDRLSGWVAATGETIANSDARLDLDELARMDSPLRSALAVPVTVDDRIVGVLSFYACQPDAFDDAHRRLVQAAAWAVASSYEAASMRKLTI